MKQLCKYRLENGRIPQYIVDGGYWLTEADQTLIGVVQGAPIGAEIISVWELQEILLSQHATETFKHENDTDMSTSEVEQLAWDFYVVKIGNPTMDEARDYRSKLLDQSDWTDLPNAPLTTQEKTDWQTYRQELRDLPQTYTDPVNVVIPTKPV